MTESEKTEIKRFDVALKSFSKAMRAKFIRKLKQGYTGWEDGFEVEFLQEQILDHAKKIERGLKNQEVDVANLALFLWWNEHRE